jgi:hypothetical protein
MNRRNFIQSGIGGLAGLSYSATPTSRQFVNASSLTEKERKVPVSGSYDVVVSGAGPAGVIAAIEAGRNGAKVLLLEVRGCLGGVWTAGLLSWILDQANKPGIMRELENRLDKMGAKCTIDIGRNLSYDVEAMKLLLEEMCLEANVDILLHTRVVGAAKDARKRLTHVITESKSGREAWEGNIFIDTSGDGDLAALSGCGFDFGSETDGSFQPTSLLSVITGVKFEEIKQFVRWSGDPMSASKKLFLDELAKANVTPSYLKPSIHPIREDLFMVMANHQYGLSGLNTRDVTKATLIARKEIHQITNGLKSLGGIWKDIRLVATAEHIGVREGRRIHGLYTVSTDDLVQGVRHDDAVCRVTFGVDVHSVRKVDDNPAASYNRGIKAKPYDIPLRALIAKDVAGLMMAGRCISGDFIAHSSYRVTGNAVAMGQAVGRVGALASAKKKLPQEITFAQVGLPKLK